jgi:phospholipid/cholesterol/gamma-HCH transport system substrate-binding protein
MGNRSKGASIKLGIFIVLGLAFFVVLLYYIGARRNMFTATTTIYAVFQNVDGLRDGNAVRFTGINVGMVRSIDLVSDSTARVAMVITNNAREFIKKDSRVTIGSEGLIGSKLINISSGTPEAASIDEGDVLPVAEPVTVDQVISLIMQTGQNARNITNDLEAMTGMIRSGEGLLGSLITDKSLSNEVAMIINQLNASSRNFNQVTGDFAELASGLRRGEGTLGQLITDDAVAIKVNELLDSLNLASHHAIQSTRSLAAYTEKLNSEEGLLGQLASDTALVEEINILLYNFNEAAKEINTTAEKINNSWIMNLFGGRSNSGTNNDK